MVQSGNKNLYNAAASSSFKANGAYLASENPLLPARPDLLGILSTDTLGIAGLQVKSFTFGQVIKFQDNSYASMPYDGILGFGSICTGLIGGSEVFPSIVAQRLVPRPIFSFYLNKYKIDETF